MSDFNHTENDTIVGTVGGTLLAIFSHLDSTDVARTVILATIGAIVSFVVSRTIKWLWVGLKSKIKKKKVKSKN